MIQKLLALFKKKLSRERKASKNFKSSSNQMSSYTDEEAQKVRERLEGLGYID